MTLVVLSGAGASSGSANTSAVVYWDYADANVNLQMWGTGASGTGSQSSSDSRSGAVYSYPGNGLQSFSDSGPLTVSFLNLTAGSMTGNFSAYANAYGYAYSSSPIPEPHGYALLLAGLGAVGLLIRHYFNLKNRGSANSMLLAGAAAVFAIVAVIGVNARTPAAPQMATASFMQARAIIERHCVSCHAAAPTHAGFAAPPAGLDLTSPEAIQLSAPRILQQTVLTEAMPLGNETAMTEAERAALGAWIRGGAHTEEGP